MKVEQSAQDMSDRFHKITSDVDLSIESIADQFKNAIEVRRLANISGHESQRTLRHLSNAMDRLVQTRESITLAHTSAQKEAERADIPWNCPPEIARAEPVQLKLVNS